MHDPISAEREKGRLCTFVVPQNGTDSSIVSSNYFQINRSLTSDKKKFLLKSNELSLSVLLKSTALRLWDSPAVISCSRGYFNIRVFKTIVYHF